MTVIPRGRLRPDCPLAILLAIAAAACGGSKPMASTPEPGPVTALGIQGAEAPPPGAPPPATEALNDGGPPPVAATAGDVSTAPLAQIVATDTAFLQRMYEAATKAPPLRLREGGPVGADPLVKGIREVSMKLPGGMKPDGPLGIGSLREKQHLRTQITLQPGKCYSVVGYSRKVRDLDLYLFLPPGILSGQDLSDDNKPVIGGPPQPMCPVGSTAITYTLDIFADAGAGEIAVQLYSKGN